MPTPAKGKPDATNSTMRCTKLYIECLDAAGVNADPWNVCAYSIEACTASARRSDTFFVTILRRFHNLEQISVDAGVVAPIGGSRGSLRR